MGEALSNGWLVIILLILFQTSPIRTQSMNSSVSIIKSSSSVYFLVVKDGGWVEN